MRAQRRQPTPFQVMPPDYELGPLMAAGRARGGEFRADVRAQFRLVVNAV